MKTLSERIDDYMQRKNLDRQTAIDNLLAFRVGRDRRKCMLSVRLSLTHNYA